MRRAVLAFAAVVLLAAGAPSRGEEAAPAPAVLLRAAAVDFAGGDADAVLVVDGRVAEIGRFHDGRVGHRAVPRGAETIHVPGGRITAGFIDAGGFLPPDPPAAESIAADHRAIDAFDPYTEHREALRAGVTAAVAAPGSARLLPGVAAVVRLSGDPAERTVLPAAALHVVLVESARRPPAVFDPPAAPASTTDPLGPARPQLPTTLAGAVLRLSEVFALARGEGEARRGEPDPLGLPVVAAALRGEIPLVIEADTAGEIRAALALAARYRAGGLRLVLAGGAEAGELAAEIAAAGVPVLLDADVEPAGGGATVEELLGREAARGAAAALRKAGGRVAFRSGGRPADLPFLAERFVREGFSREDLLRSLTVAPAEIFGVADRLGRIAAGGPADLVVTDAGGAVRAVVAAGRIVRRPAAESGRLLVRGRVLHLGDGQVVREGHVLTGDGRILEVGTGETAAADRVIEGAVVVPGFIDAHSYLGLMDSNGRGTPPASLPLDVPAGMALAPGAPEFLPALRAGITGFLAAPPGTGLVPGAASFAFTAGETREELLGKSPAAVVFHLAGQNDLPSALEQLRGLLSGAKAYADQHAAHVRAQAEYDQWVAAGRPGEVRDAPKPPNVDAGREPLRAMLSGRLPALVRARSVPEVRETLALFGEFGVAPLFVGAEDATSLAPGLREAGSAVILIPPFLADGPAGRTNRAATFAAAGVPVLFGSSSALGAADLHRLVKHAVREGLPPGAALSGLTGGAADRLQVADRTGRLKAGLAADLLVLSGPPLDPATRVLFVVRGGRVVYEEEAPR